MILNRIIFLISLLTTLGWAQSNDDCMMCHSDPELTKLVDDTVEVSMYVDQEAYDNSIHGFFECMDCHMDIEDIPHEENLQKVDCANCHDDATEAYGKGIHGIAYSGGSDIAATCADCHGKHDILSSDDPNSKTFHGNLAVTCGNCHSRPEVNMRFGARDIDRVELYKKSVHGRLLQEDPEMEVATCTDCHGSHEVLSPIHPESGLHVLKISETCGKCHESEAEEYHQSIHWFSLEHGHYESPTCTDCHGEHEISNPAGDSELASLKSTEICASCHSSEVMMNRFGMDHRRLDSYMKSYHGLAVLRGSPETATCTSCHEVHAIKSKMDSTSSVHTSNLIETCGKCHNNPTEAFVQIDMHPVDQQTRNPIAFFFKGIYTWMIIGTIGAMLIHNIIILVYYIREKKKLKQGSILYQRFQPFEVYQHMLLFLSFATLVVTGFALKFPDADWARLLLHIGLDEGLRSLLHRIAAVVMVVISLIQVYYFFFTKKGRRDAKALIPTLDDFKHFSQNMRYHLGLSKEHPKYGRYDYTEKAEYLALIWGILVMGVTGFILWFPEFFFRFLPSWLFETAEVIHYYEAWLATLAIVVWHWFFVIYHPEKYPMNTTWTDGKITIDELKEHHPAEYEEYIKKQENNEHPEHRHD